MLRREPMIVIGNQFWREKELLLLKLKEIDLQLSRFNYDWKMVIVESDHTFTGTPKPFYLDEWLDEPEFIPFVNRLHRIKMNGFGPDTVFNKDNAMKNDFIQKCAIADGFKNIAGPDDICVLCDLDEIPDFRAIYKFFNSDLSSIDNIYTLNLMLFYYSYNNLANFVDDRVTIFKMKDFKGVTEHRAGPSLGVPRIMIPNSGWHFSYLGDIDTVRSKIQNFGHSELNTPEIMNALGDRFNSGNDPYGRYGFNFSVSQIDDRWPEVLIKNIDMYSHNIWVPRNPIRKPNFNSMITNI